MILDFLSLESNKSKITIRFGAVHAAGVAGSKL